MEINRNRRFTAIIRSLSLSLLVSGVILSPAKMDRVSAAGSQKTGEALSGSYTVKSGDTLYGISRQTLGKGMEYPVLAKVNSDRVKNPDLIYPGWELKIPGDIYYEDTVTITYGSSGKEDAGESEAKQSKAQGSKPKKSDTKGSGEKESESVLKETESGDPESQSAEPGDNTREQENIEQEAEEKSASEQDPEEQKTEEQETEEKSTEEQETEEQETEEQRTEEQESSEQEAPLKSKTKSKDKGEALNKLIKDISQDDDQSGQSKENEEDNDSSDSNSDKPFVFNNWVEDSENLSKIKDYVTSVTNENSSSFIPQRDRVAVFDFDGTLYGELCPTYVEWMLLTHRITRDESFTPNKELRTLAQDILKAAEDGQVGSDLPARVQSAFGEAFKGMSPEEFREYVLEFIKTPVIGFDDMTWKDAFYKPMLELISYLQENGFSIYIVTGSSHYTVRAIAEGVLDIPPSNIFGSSFGLLAWDNIDNTPLHRYDTKGEDKVVFSGEFSSINLKYNKVVTIKDRIGQQPVLCFGNSSGDIEMARYTIKDNPYPSKAFFILADDEDRDYGNEKAALIFQEGIKDLGISCISMRDDWTMIY